MISLYLGWNGYSRGSIPLASYCLSNTKNKKMKLKNKYRFLVAWTLFNTFLTPDKLTDLVQINPANFKKKGCEKPSFLLISCITKIAKDLAGVDG